MPSRIALFPLLLAASLLVLGLLPGVSSERPAPARSPSSQERLQAALDALRKYFPAWEDGAGDGWFDKARAARRRGRESSDLDALWEDLLGASSDWILDPEALSPPRAALSREQRRLAFEVLGVISDFSWDVTRLCEDRSGDPRRWTVREYERRALFQAFLEKLGGRVEEIPDELFWIRLDLAKYYLESELPAVYRQLEERVEASLSAGEVPAGGLAYGLLRVLGFDEIEVEGVPPDRVRQLLLRLEPTFHASWGDDPHFRAARCLCFVHSVLLLRGLAEPEGDDDLQAAHRMLRTLELLVPSLPDPGSSLGSRIPQLLKHFGWGAKEGEVPPVQGARDIEARLLALQANLKSPGAPLGSKRRRDRRPHEL